VTEGALQQALGPARAAELRERSLALFAAGGALAEPRGIIIADTKFEFGVSDTGELVLIDEVLTPDSSRFWPADRYQTGKSQPSFDKQPLRDYLAGLRAEGRWNGDAPAPPLPPEVVAATSARYLEAYRLLTGNALPEAA
jgi:phosphoribosylaminoimidazole-succinocarboxamide synthase